MQLENHTKYQVDYKKYKPFSKSLYDSCNIKKKNQESTGPYKWVMDNVKESPDSCWVQTSPFMHNQFQSIPLNVIDVESDLRNQTRILSRCPQTRFDPTKLENCKTCKKCNSGLPCECGHCRETKNEFKIKECSNKFLVPNYTRVQKPCNIYSGITINRFNPLCDDAQELNSIHSNIYIGSNSRLQVKDNFEKHFLKDLEKPKLKNWKPNEFY